MDCFPDETFRGLLKEKGGGTGTTYDENTLDGRNLLPLLETEAKLERALYWEMRIPDGYNFSVLDRTHRWRYSTGFLGGQWLYDLDQDPTSSISVLADNPQIAQQLKTDYDNWHDTIRRVQTEFEAQDQNGKGILTGDSFQRSPGFGGFTFAIGVTPEQNSDTSQRRVIASQNQLLSLDYQSESVELNLQDVQLTASLPADGQCHSIIITAHHEARISWLMANRAMNPPVDLIIDGTVAASLVDHRELPKAATLTNPTFIRYRPGEPLEQTGFEGKLSLPIIFNQKLRPDTDVGQSDIESLMQEVCPDA